MLEGIKAILQHEPKIEIVGTAVDGRAAISQAQKLQPDIVLSDIEMPVMNGIVATRYIARHLPHTRIIILTSHKNQQYLAQALQAGASGYLLKDSLVEDLKQAIYASGKGYTYVDAKLLTQTVKKTQRTNIIKDRPRISYLKKHQKSNYIPSRQNRVRQSTSSQSKLSDGMTKVNLMAIFEPSLADVPTPLQNRVTRSHKPNQKKYFKKIIWLFIAIASLILSLIIF
jgi:DNA-binding NarL/FixJ family response regulator